MDGWMDVTETTGILLITFQKCYMNHLVSQGSYSLIVYKLMRDLRVSTVVKIHCQDGGSEVLETLVSYRNATRRHEAEALDLYRFVSMLVRNIVFFFVCFR
jgi:hypothetical protein